MSKIEIPVINVNVALQYLFSDFHNNIAGAILVDNQPIDMKAWRAAATFLDLAYVALDDNRFASVEYLIGELNSFSFTTTAVIELERALSAAKEEA